LKTFIAIVAITFSFAIGLTVNSILYAQNSTQYAPVVQSSDALLTSIVSIIIAIAGIVTALVNKGILSKNIGTVAVMASDTAWAVKDNRQMIKDGMQTGYDTVKISNPEAAAYADKNISPQLDKATVMVNEYTDKVNKFADIANKLSNGGKKADDKITDMKDDIPDRIVPS